jgi:predicted ATPase
MPTSAAAAAAASDDDEAAVPPPPPRENKSSEKKQGKARGQEEDDGPPSVTESTAIEEDCFLDEAPPSNAPVVVVVSSSAMMGRADETESSSRSTTSIVEQRRSSAASASASAASSSHSTRTTASNRSSLYSNEVPAPSFQKRSSMASTSLGSSSAGSSPRNLPLGGGAGSSGAIHSESYRRLQNLTVNKLQFDKLGRLYGRESQCQRLEDAFRDMVQAARRRRREFDGDGNNNNNDERRQSSTNAERTQSSPSSHPHHPSHLENHRWFVAITGESGSGKSTLAETLRHKVGRAGGFFVQGKFPQPTSMPSSASAPASPTSSVHPTAPSPPPPSPQPKPDGEPFAAFAEATADLSDAVAAMYSPQLLRSTGSPFRNSSARRMVNVGGGGDGGEAEPSRPVAAGTPRGGGGDAGTAAAAAAAPATRPASLALFREQLGIEMGDDAALIVRVIPESNHLLGSGSAGGGEATRSAMSSSSQSSSAAASSASSSIGYKEANHRFKAAFRRFIRAMTKVAPLVIVLDDMQWADTASMELLEALVSDRELSSLLVIGCYRTYVQPVPPVVALDAADVAAGILRSAIPPPHIRAVEAIRNLSHSHESGLHFDSISVERLNAVQINDLLMDLLSLPASDTFNLAYCVHKKTLGNVFFVIQYLTLLQESNLLEYNLCALKWTFNLAEIRDSTFATDNVVHLVKSKLERLPSATVKVLPVMACLGSTFTLRSFELVVTELSASVLSPPSTSATEAAATEAAAAAAATIDASDSRPEAPSPGADAVRYLLQCETEGLIEMTQDDEKTSYRWAHDKIQEAALSLVDDDELHSLRLVVGQILWERFNARELEENIFLVSRLLTSDRHIGALSAGGERSTKLAALFLRAGSKAVERSAYEIASGYLLSGIYLLPADHWEMDSDLSLDLLSTAAEVEFCLGRLDVSKHFSNEVIAQEFVPFLSKRRAYNMLISCYAAEQRKDDAFGLCKDLLAKLGCKFPTKALTLHVAAGIFRIKSSLKRYTSRETFRQLPALTDERYRWVMTLLDKLATYAYLTNPILLPLISFRGLHVTLKMGLCEYAPQMFSSIGFLLAAFVHDFEGGQAFADQAIDLLSHVKSAKKVEARVLFLTHSFIIHWTRPVSLSLKPLRRSFECGMAMGDVESACYGICFYVDHAFRTGTPLPELIDDCSYYADSIRESQQMNTLYTMNYLWQTFLFLTGDDVYTGEFSGSIMDQETALSEVAKENHTVLFYGIYRLQMYVAFVFGQYEQVYKAIIITGTHRGAYEQVFPGIFGMCHLHTFNGLSLLSLYRETKESKYLKIAKNFAAKIKKWVKKGVSERSLSHDECEVPVSKPPHQCCTSESQCHSFRRPLGC